MLMKLMLNISEFLKAPKDPYSILITGKMLSFSFSPSYLGCKAFSLFSPPPDKPCGHPGDTDFGFFELTSGTEFVFGARVEYRCNDG